MHMRKPAVAINGHMRSTITLISFVINTGLYVDPYEQDHQQTVQDNQENVQSADFRFDSAQAIE